MKRLRPQHQDSVDFLERWDPKGLWVLVAIGADKHREISAATFSSEERSAALGWIKEQNKDRNVYFTVNPVAEPLNKKPKREDIQSMSWLHVDVDPRVGENIEAERARILALFNENLPASVPTPTAVVFSGGGYQGFWRLETPFSIKGDPGKYEEAKRWNMQLELLFSGDSCHNVDRIMRLPGTINWPDERKKRKGRVPTLAVLSQWNGHTYDLEDFTPAALVQSKDAQDALRTGDAVKISGNVKRLNDVNELGDQVQDYCKVIIVQGHDPDEPDKWDSRSETTWYVVCELVRSGVDDDTIYSVITDPGFKISGHILDQDDPEKAAKRHIERAREHAIHPVLQELNGKHAVIADFGGKCRVTNEVRDPMLGRTNFSFQAPNDFRMRYMNRMIEYEDGAGKSRSMPLGDWWLKHPNRKQFDTIVFAPEIEVPGSFNLWRGFSCTAQPGDCQLFLDHLLENICCGNEEHYAYLIGWMAHAVQKPAVPGYTAVVLRGAQGTGKSFFAKTFGHLFGHHFLQVSDPKHLVGAFNAHLRDCVVLFGDEAFYAGDKRHEGALKTLVTEEMLSIEGKGVNLVTTSNCLHIILASNSDWVVPAGESERRYFMLDVSDAKKQDTTYFRLIQNQLDSGGYEALLHFLRTYDLAAFNVRKMPTTRALQDQKILSYGAEHAWWYNKLVQGELVNSMGWPEGVYTEVLSEDYRVYMSTFGRSAGNGSQVNMHRFLKTVLPGGEVVKRQQSSGMYEINGRTKLCRPYIMAVPPLEKCRERWEKLKGEEFPWEDIEQIPETESHF